MSEANRTFLAYIPETTPGTTPSAGDFKKIPFTAAPDFSFNPNTVQSTEIRSDRQKDDLSLVGIEAGGSVDIELAISRYDDLLEAALFDSWNKLQSSASEVARIDAGKLTYTNASDIPDTFKKSGILLLENAGQSIDTFPITAVAGKDVSLTGLVTNPNKAANFKATLVGLSALNANWNFTANKIEIDNADAKAILENVDIKAGDWVAVSSGTFSERAYFRITKKEIENNKTTLAFDSFINLSEAELSRPISATHKELYFSNSLKNGTTSKSFSILQSFLSLNPVVQAVFSGCKVGSLALSFETQAIITGSFGFLGLNSKYLPALIPDSRIKDSEVAAILNSSNNVGKIYVGGAEVDGPNFVQSGSLNIENNIRRQNAVGSLGSVGLPAGTNVITGALTTYFGNKDLAEAVINNSESSYVLQLTDKHKKKLIIDVPRLKFSTGSPGIPGENTDIIVPLEYQAIRHRTLGYQLKLCSFPFV